MKDREKQVKFLRFKKAIPSVLQRMNSILGKTAMYIIFAANVVALILLCLSVSAWYIPPYQSEIPAYLGLGFMILFVVNVLYFLMWIIFLKWKLALFDFIILIFCWTPISAYFPLHQKSETIPEECIKLMTYNVMGFNWETDKKARENPIFEYMANSGADIICMQEFVINNKKYNRRGIISISEVDKIMKDYPHRSIVRFGKAEGQYSFGIACYSKYPIRKTTQIPLDSEFNGAALYKIRIKGKDISLINIHLESNRITSEDKQLYADFIDARDKETLDLVTQNIQDRLGKAYIKRAHQAEIVAQWVENQKTDGTIVCGDFNDTPISYVYKTIKGEYKLVDSFAETGMGQGISYNRNMFWFRIDYIMHSKNISSYNSFVDKVMYSDHYPLITYLHLDGE